MSSPRSESWREVQGLGPKHNRATSGFAVVSAKPRIRAIRSWAVAGHVVDTSTEGCGIIRSPMADVFISYVEEDSPVAMALSEGLETSRQEAPRAEAQRTPTPRGPSLVLDADSLRRLAVNVAGVKRGAVLQEVIARFGAPRSTGRDYHLDTTYHFGTPEEFDVTAFHHGGRISSVKIRQAAVQTLRSRGVNDPMLGFFGQTKAQLVAALGQPYMQSGAVGVYEFSDIGVEFELDDRRQGDANNSAEISTVGGGPKPGPGA